MKALLVTVLTFLLIGSTSCLSMAGEAIYTLHKGELDAPFTLTTRISFPAREDHEVIESIWLAGFAASGNTRPDDLTVAWRKEGWFNIWRLGLESKLGIIPFGLDPELVPGSQLDHRFITLTSESPEVGHVYEATTSFDPASGYLAIGIVDVTTQEPYYNGVVKLGSVDKPLVGGIGLELAQGVELGVVQPTLEVVKVERGLVPAGVQWRLVERHKVSNEWLPTQQLDRKSEAAIQVNTGSDAVLPGHLRFYFDNGKSRWKVAELFPIKGQALLPLQAADVPAGEGFLVMEYEVDGSKQFTATRSLSVGVLTLTLADLAVDMEAEVVRGAFLATGDGDIPNIKFSGQIRIERQALLSGDVAQDEVIPLLQELDATAEPNRIDFDIPVSDYPVKSKVTITPHIATSPGIEQVMDTVYTKTVITGVGTDLAQLLAKVRTQYIDEFLLTGVVNTSIPPLASDGSWADVDYIDQNVASWKTAEHLNRVLRMAKTFRLQSKLSSGNKGLRNNIVASLQFWVAKKFRNPNWWYNEILVPQLLGDILLLMEDEIPMQLRQAVLDLMRPEIARLSARESNGTNLVWNETNRIRLGLLDNDLAAVVSAFAKLASELKVVSVTEEGGVQIDYSFHQHGSILYSGGYGAGFAGDLSRLAYVARGTNLLPPYALQVLVHYVLDGQQWMVRGRTFDFSAVGREISRGHASGNASYLTAVCERLLAMPGVPRRAELQAFVARLNGTGKALEGNRHFWTSEFMTHHREDYYISLKAASSRTVATEIGNGENLKGYHLGDGMMYIMRSGTEYDRIFPVWDWERLPGTTVEQSTHPALNNKWLAVQGSARLAGGASNGQYGAMGMWLQKDSLSAKKAWFFFERELVALGADIMAKSNNAVLTTVNQARLSGDITAETSQAKLTLEKGQHVLEETTWVHHDGIGYFFPGTSTVTIGNQIQTGSWYDLNHSRSSQMETLPVFSLWFDHGSSPAKGNYAYMVVPGISRQELEAYVQDNGVNIVANKPEVQGVWHEGLKMLQVVFWAPGTVTTPSGLDITVDKPAVLLVIEQAGQVEVTASTLELRSTDLSVRLEMANSNWSGLLPFTFTGGDYIGQSLTQTISF